jgi:alkylation response protein AidB-like acyl-CoA dehydrogenase
MSQTSTSPLLKSVAEIAPVLRLNSAEAEETRTLPKASYDAMVEAGLFRMFIPKSLGGLQTDVVSGFEAIEAVARVDSAAAWCLQIGAATVGIAALLPEAGVQEVFSNPNATLAGGFHPPGAAVPVEGGYRISGRWGWASGCQHATWIMCPGLQMKDGAPETTPDGEPIERVGFCLASEVQVVDTWYSMGMRGTGSHDVVARDVFVPEQRAAIFRPFTVEPNHAFDGPFVRMGIMPTILGNAIVALAIARTALDQSLDLVRSKVPAHMQTPPVQRSTVQGHLGRAEATISAARAYFFDSLAAGWGAAQRGPVGIEERKHLQLAASYAAESAARAVDYIHAAVGGDGVLEARHDFARHFRDVHTITQHALCSGARFESAGQVMLGLETDWLLFNI